MVSPGAGSFASFIRSCLRNLRLKLPRGTSIQWALPLVPQLLPDDVYAQFRTTAVDPLTEPGGLHAHLQWSNGRSTEGV